jgi:hypothetical protein
MEATTGFEPVHRGFADPRLNHLATSPLPAFWSGRRDSNSRLPPWQGGVLPLNYFRISSVTWCRGGDLNSDELTLTTPSRWRVYQLPPPRHGFYILPSLPGSLLSGLFLSDSPLLGGGLFALSPPAHRYLLPPSKSH